MRRPRGLSREDAALWARVAKTVVPLEGRNSLPPEWVAAHSADAGSSRRAKQAPSARFEGHAPLSQREDPKPAIRPLDRHGLDSSWERKLARGGLPPDFTLDLHGLGLDAAHGRLDAGLAQAHALGARVVLVIAGRPRPVDAADRGTARGAIRAKLLDWLAAGPHAGRIAAVRTAHRRHGGAGAVYVVLRRPR